MGGSVFGLLLVGASTPPPAVSTSPITVIIILCAQMIYILQYIYFNLQMEYIMLVGASMSTSTPAVHTLP